LKREAAMPFPQILVVDDEPNSLFGICQILRDEGFNVIPTENGRAALRELETNPINVVVCDVRMSDLNGIELLGEIKKKHPHIPVIMITAYGSVSMAVDALKMGAFYFFEKPLYKNLEQFLTILRQALKAQEMEKELDSLRKEVTEKYSFPNIVGRHPRMIEIFEIITRVSRTDRTILIQGESGTGKDLVAKTIHYNSLRRTKPLVYVNCGALTDSLLTTELFGHKKGAFTGATSETTGRFQMADGGTLVLDEVGEIPFHLQKTLLRVIEEKEFEKVGDSRSISVDVRIISTSNRELREEVAKGNFREDLYHRLSIVPITVPPLRERASDIPLLVHHFLSKIPDESKRVRVDPKVIERLKTYPWSGNVRELVNVIQQMTIFCDENRITVDDLPSLQLFPKESAAEEGKGKVDLIRIVSDLERKWILRKLDEGDWNREKTAALLGMTRKMLNNRIAKYKIKPPSKQRS
jgi:two-component system NtrC family response regulator